MGCFCAWKGMLVPHELFFLNRSKIVCLGFIIIMVFPDLHSKNCFSRNRRPFISIHKARKWQRFMSYPSLVPRRFDLLRRFVRNGNDHILNLVMSFSNIIVGSWNLCEKSRSMLHRRSWVFSWESSFAGYSGFLPQGMLTTPFHRSCAPWSDMSPDVAARGAFRKSSSRSGWAASFAIQFTFQLQIMMFSTPSLTY
jgi:hypothetical protein